MERKLGQMGSRNAKQDHVEVVRFTGERRLDKVITVRLPADKWVQIRKEASEFGITPSTLARIWILDSLRKANVSETGAGEDT
ncbi:MAG: hypothetical protein ACLFVA_03910 [Dehalococcoidia bacterium]